MKTIRQRVRDKLHKLVVFRAIMVCQTKLGVLMKLMRGLFFLMFLGWDRLQCFRGREAHRRLWRPRGFSKRHLDRQGFAHLRKARPGRGNRHDYRSGAICRCFVGKQHSFATGSATGPLAAAVRGSDLKVLAASFDEFPYAFVVKPEIRNPKELRGKRVNILNYGGSNDLALQLALKEWGMKLYSISQVIIGGDAPTRWAR